jgi:hypothetical protein
VVNNPAFPLVSRKTTQNRTWSVLFKEVIPVYSEDLTKFINRLYSQNADLLLINTSGIYNYHWALKD